MRVFGMATGDNINRAAAKDAKFFMIFLALFAPSRFIFNFLKEVWNAYWHDDGRV